MPARVLVTADLHYNIARSRAPAEDLARRACELGGDALVLAGDTAGADLEPLRQCLALFAGFPGRKLLVPGNHCLWCRGEESSLERYERILPRVAAGEGFRVLDHKPAVLGDVALVGSIGWYDYSFRDESLGIPEAFYRAKVSPGAAAWLGGHEELIAAHRDELTEAQMAIAARWRDGEHVRLGVSDEEFVERLAAKLARQLAEAEARAERILVFLHHLPFAELVPRGRPGRFAFAAAYLGARRLGEVLHRCEKLTDVYCGHSHWPARRRIGRLNVVNVGSTYTYKQLEVVEL